MSNTRVRYGWALGPEGSAGATSGGHTFTPGDTTPDVSNGVFFLTANTSATTISYFDLVGKGGIDPVSQNNGKVIEILFQDAVTTISNTANVFLAQTGGALPANATLRLVHYNSSWFELSRSVNAQEASVNTYRRLNISQAASNAINVTTADIVAITVTGANLVITGFAGGRSNQTIRIIYTGQSSQLLGFAQSAGNLVLSGTNALNFTGSGTYSFTTLDGNQWFNASGLTGLAS